MELLARDGLLPFLVVFGAAEGGAFVLWGAHGCLLRSCAVWVPAVVLYALALWVCLLVGECPCRCGCLRPGYVCWMAWQYRVKPGGEPCLLVGGGGGGGAVVVGGDGVQQGPRIVEGCQAAVPPRAWYALTGGTSVMAVPAAVKAQRASSRHLSKLAPQAHGPPQTRPKQRQGPPAASLLPYPPSMSAHIQQMPRYRRHRESQPNPETETLHAYPRVHIRPRPRCPRTPTAQDYEESPGPATATSPHDPITPTHAHSSAQGHGLAQGQSWRRWTHMQLWELRNWARAEPSLRGLVHLPRKGSVENRSLQPAGALMPQAAWEAMLADALHPLGVHP